MWFYRVTVVCSGVPVRVDDESRVYGFYKNEYVWATNDERAKAKAVQKVRRALEQNPSIGVEDASTIGLEIDHNEQSRSVWKVIRPEGFVFYEPNSKEAGDS